MNAATALLRATMSRKQVSYPAYMERDLCLKFISANCTPEQLLKFGEFLTANIKGTAFDLSVTEQEHREALAKLDILEKAHLETIHLQGI